ncbi:S9 family peptidase [Paludibacter sp. 221]|uniref:alpha/beta hydrolase family protein n=1 Tax=Paludibacter sp. 221 TaxID=2302939 RepID=UPI0013D6325E|nr:prolyl oligopeptidase family serine peptidase [Paludibacter sp. 221]NDV45935.1 S9 family peptidase [Paludibacter sp. 221]
MLKKNTFLTLLLLLCTLNTIAQKSPLNHDVYDSWKSLKNTSITNDGKFAIAVVAEQEGDDYLYIQNLSNRKELTVPRGYSYELVPDNKYVIAKIKASHADIREAKIKKKAAEKMPKDSLAVIRLDDLSVVKIPSVKDFKTGKDFSAYVAYTLSDSIKSKEKTSTLVIRNIESSTEDTIKNVSAYSFSKNGKALAVTTKPEKKDSVNEPSVFLLNLEKYSKNLISSGKTEYISQALSEDGMQLAFLATADTTKQENKEYKLYYYKHGADSAFVVANKAHENMPDKWIVSKNRTPLFSKNGKRLLFGIAPMPLEKDTTIPDFEKAGLDIWHWQEPEIQPVQLKTLDADKKKSYLAYIDLNNPQVFTQLANDTIPNVYLSEENNGEFAIGVSKLPYLLKAQWDTSSRYTQDVWSYNLTSGERKLIKKGLTGNYSLSYNGNYLVWYDLNTRNYYAYELKTDEERCLTCGLNINFWNEENDTPTIPLNYGMGMWYENDNALLVYDQYDIWKLDPSGKTPPQNITKGEGRKNKTTLRHIKTNPDAKFITSKEQLLLSAFNNENKKNGYYLLGPKNNLQKLVLDGYTFSSVKKAKDKDSYLYIKSNFATTPDLYSTTNNWKSERKLTEINPQAKNYKWGSVELTEWKTFDGKTAQGLLYKPENFDANKKYPMLTYFYERSSDNLYTHYMPQPNWSIINISYYVSNDYIVFVPDIHYTDGHPGQCAYNYVISGVEKLCENPWVDKENLGVQGQSWGGYQVAYLITRTNIFKCAGSGAPVSNMFSAYNGIRWESGRSRQYQYEQGQSRIGKNMWEAPELYHENSPIFFADKVETPLLIMHNDQDGAVPWYQGIEYFMALRRLQKPVWMLQYNKEAHNLKERRNRKDLTVRLQQFFDHYLKNEPMPKWLKSGVPAIEKGIDYGFGIEE